MQCTFDSENNVRVIVEYSYERVSAGQTQSMTQRLSNPCSAAVLLDLNLGLYIDSPGADTGTTLRLTRACDVMSSIPPI